MIRTCFILDELYPVDRGGIGRLMFNIVHHAKQQHPELDLHILLGQRPPDEMETLHSAFADVAWLHFVDDDTAISDRLGIKDIAASVATSNSLNPVFQNGLRVLETLLSIQETVGTFDHIEIPDHMGLGAVILMAREAGIAFQTAQITCRLHSSLSAIMAVEPFHHPRSEWVAPRVEMERYSLDKADRIIAHIPAIAAFNKTHFGFDDAWLAKVETSFPPAIWPRDPVPPNPLPAAPDFIFTSRFQPFKRPALFIKAAATFLDRNPEYTGAFRLISYGFNREYVDALRMVVPRRYLDRIKIELDLPAEVRDRAMIGAIIVQPSNFESLCTLAFEVASNQNPVLLARDCLAFGEFDRWVDGENCLMFDPDPKALADTMQAALNWSPTAPVNTKPDPIYFANPVSVRSDTLLPLQTLGILVGPLKTPDDFTRFALFIDTTTVRVTGYSPEKYSAFYPDASAVHWLNEAANQGEQVLELAQKFDLIVVADPNALPSPEFLHFGQKIARKGRAFSSNSLRPKGRRLNIYSGKMASLLASDYRLCPPCVMLHRDDLGLIIAPLDDRDLNLRLLARLAGANIDLTMAPTPMIIETTPLLDEKPDRRLLGYDPSTGWQDGINKIAVDVKTARHTPLLTENETTPVSEHDLSQVKVSANTPLTLTFSIPQPILGDILGIRVENLSDDCPMLASLHYCNEMSAQEAHINGLQTRKFAPKQRYIARWGPLWQAKNLVFVVTATTDIVIKLDRFIIFSRE